MIKNITIGQYIPGKSVIHSLDPRMKILITLLYMITIFLVNSFLGYLVLVLFLALVMKLGDLKLKFVLKGLKPILILLSFTAILNMLIITGQGEPLISIGIFSIYREGVIRAVFMLLRITLLVVGTTILTLTTSPIELTDAIERLLNPFKKIGVPAHELAMMMTIALRFIPILIDETDKLMKAQMSRGVDFEEGNLVQRAKSLVPILVPLFISAFRRADDLATAMEARGYRGGAGRTRMKILKTNSRDYYALGVFSVFLLLVVYTRFV